MLTSCAFGNTYKKPNGEAWPDAFNLAEFRTSNTWRLYQVMLDQARVRHQLDQLRDERATGNLDLKTFLRQKRDLQNRIHYLGLELRDTCFDRAHTDLS